MDEETPTEQQPISLDDVITAVQSLILNAAQAKAHAQFLGQKLGETMVAVNSLNDKIAKISKFVEDQDARITVIKSYIKGADNE